MIRASAFHLAVCAASLALLCCGCSTRETNKALQQGDQAVEASRAILSQPKVAEAIASLPPDLQAVMAEALCAVDQLLASARTSIAPAITLSAQGEKIDPGTAVDQAVRDPAGFAAIAHRQAGRAEVEVEGLLPWLEMKGAALRFAQAAASDWMAQMLAGGGTGGLLLAGGLKVLAVVRRLKREIELREAETEDALAYGNAAEQADTTAQIEELKRDHLKRQAARGTLPGIAAKLSKMKSPKPSRLA